MNCPRCNAAIGKRLTCPKCGIVCRNSKPRRLRRKETYLRNLDGWDSMEYRRKSARQELEGESIRMGLRPGGTGQDT